MAAPTYNLKVITPQGVGYTGEVSHTLLPSEDGLVGVLAHHAPYVTSSGGGKLQVREIDGQEKSFQVGLGFFEVAHNQATFLTQSLKADNSPSS